MTISTIKTPTIKNFDISLIAKGILSTHFKTSFGSQKVKELSDTLTEHAMWILQRNLQAAPIDNPIQAANGALLFLTLLSCLKDLDPARRIETFAEQELDEELYNVFWMFHSDEILRWAKSALDFYMSLPDAFLSEEHVQDAIKTIHFFNNIISSVSEMDLKAA